jgi:hypothetical protein
MRSVSRLTFSTLLVAGACLSCLSAAWAEQRKADSGSDPHWEGFRNRLLPATTRATKQDFGLQASNTIAGWIQRSTTPAWFARVIPTRTLEDELEASGKFAVTQAGKSSGMLFGWFNENSHGWRTPNSLAFRLDGNGGKYWVLFEYGTHNWLTGGTGCFEGPQYQKTPTKPFLADGTVHAWALRYLPRAASGQGEVRFVLDGKEYVCPLAPGHKADGATFNRFGVFNHQTTGKGMEVCFSDLLLQGKPLEQGAQWEGKGNHVQFQDRVLRPLHDFGYTPPDSAHGQKGRIGGIIWRDPHPAYFADKTGRLTLDDELFASGKLAFNNAGSDSGAYFGWFDSASNTNKSTAESKAPQQNILAVLIEGPSRIGHYFRPAFRDRDGDGGSPKIGPIIRPDGTVHTWAIHYLPHAADGQGQIAVTFDGQEQTLPLTAKQRQTGAVFDHFGLFNFQSGGQYVEVSLDELTYTVASP